MMAGWWTSVADYNWRATRLLNRACGEPRRFVCRGRIQMTLAGNANVVAPSQRTYIGLRLLGDLSPAGATTVLVAGPRSTLALDGVYVGRGARLGVTAGGRLEIGPGTYVADGSRLCAAHSILVGRRCAISWNVTVLDDDGHGSGPPPYTAPIHIEDDVWIGCNAIILQGVTIGAGSIVAAGAVVTRSHPPRSLLGGVPARVLRSNVSWTDAHRSASPAPAAVDQADRGLRP